MGKWYNYASIIALIVHQVIKEMNPNVEIADYNVSRKYMDDFASFHFTENTFDVSSDFLKEYFGKDISEILDIVRICYCNDIPMDKKYYKFNVVQKEKCINYIIDILLNYDCNISEGIDINMVDVFVKVYNILESKEVYNLPFTIKKNMNGIYIWAQVKIITSALILIDFLLNDTYCSKEDSALLKNKYVDINKTIAKRALVGNKIHLGNEVVTMYLCFYLYYAEDYLEILNKLLELTD